MFIGRFGEEDPLMEVPTAQTDLRETAHRMLGTVPGTDPEETETPQARLGQALFWDIRLSADGNTACASRHYRENWGSDSRTRSIDDAMTEQQIAGLERFITVGCVGCHDGPLVGGEMLQRFGVIENDWEHTGSPYIDSGLMVVTGEERDRFFFRVPLLRNVANTGSYFHDGSVADLRRATEIMARIQLGQTLSAEAIDELVAFQEALTGDLPANFEPPEGIPFELPAGVEAP